MKKRINSRSCLGYIGIMFMANLAGSLGGILNAYFNRDNRDNEWIIQHSRLISFLYILVAIAVTTAITGIYFHRKMPNMISSESNANWEDILKIFCRLVLPGEILRLLLAVLTRNTSRLFGYRFLDRFFAGVPNYLYNQFYEVPNNRLDSILGVRYTIADTLFYLLFYLIYLAVILSVYFVIFKAMWKTAKPAHKNEIELCIDPSQME